MSPAFAVVLAALIAVAALAALIGRLGVSRATVTASVRAVLQPGVVSLLITAVLRSWWPTAGFVALMVLVAAGTSARPVVSSVRLGWPVVAPIAAGALPIGAGIVAAGTLPLTEAAVLPIAGILIGGAMTATSLSGRRPWTSWVTGTASTRPRWPWVSFPATPRSALSHRFLSHTGHELLSAEPIVVKCRTGRARVRQPASRRRTAMTDHAPRSDADTAAQPTAAAAGPVGDPAVDASRPEPARRWNWLGTGDLRGRRVPLVVAAATLLLGCVLGGGLVAIGALAGDGHHGDDRGHSRGERRPDGRDDAGRGKGDGRDGSRDNNDATPAPTSSAPSPAAS